MTSGHGLRIWMPAAAIAVIVALCLGIAGQFLFQAGLRQSSPILEESTQTGAAAVGSAIAAQFARAFDLGIPVDRLVGVENYMERIVETSPQVSGLALLDGDGRVINATGPDISGEAFPISADRSNATLVVAQESPLYDQALWRLQMSLILAAVLGGVVAGVVTGSFLTFSQRPARDRLARSLERVANGDFSQASAATGRDRFSRAARALDGWTDQVDKARQRLAEAVATIRAIDFDGSLGRRVDAILEPIDGKYSLAEKRDDDAAPNDSGDTVDVIGRVAMVVGLYAAAFPLVANFAIDREFGAIPAGWIPVVPLMVELVSLALGAVLGLSIAGRLGSLRCLGILVLGIATAAVYWCRTYELFVVLRSITGLAVGFVLAGLSGGLPRLFRHRTTLLFAFAGLVAAPLFIGLLGEALGRRAAFLILGGLSVALTPFLVGSFRTGEGVHRMRAGGAWGWAQALVALPAVPLLLVYIPAGIGFDNYLQGSLAIAAFGLSCLLGFRIPLAVTGAVVVISGLALVLAPLDPRAPAFIASAALGLAAGACLGRPIPAPPNFLALAVGGLAGLVAVAMIKPSTALLAGGVAVALLALVAGGLLRHRQIARG